MQSHCPRVNAVVAAVVFVTCLLNSSAVAQEVGPETRQGTVSDEDFRNLQQQIKDLKNPTFRAFLRTRLL